MAEAASAKLQEPAFAIERESGRSPIVLICDHASNHLPPRFGTLGLAPGELVKHFAWDPGALATCRLLSQLLDAPLVYGRISRLALDVNRYPSDPDSIVTQGDGQPVPGNVGLSAAERARRAAEIYEPYHAAVEALIAQRLASRTLTAVIALHTFTPVMNGVTRPWHCGVIFAGDGRIGGPLVAGLRAERGLVVGVNEPYAPSDRVYHTMLRHGEARGLPAAMIEVRNDLVADSGGQAAWAKRLAPLLLGAAQACFEASGLEGKT